MRIVKCEQELEDALNRTVKREALLLLRFLISSWKGTLKGPVTSIQIMADHHGNVVSL